MLVAQITVVTITRDFIVAVLGILRTKTFWTRPSCPKVLTRPAHS